MSKLRLPVISFICTIVIIVVAACDDYSHTSVVNTPPINFVNLTMLRSWGGTGFDWGVSLFATEEGDYLIAGSTTSNGYGVSTAYLARTSSKGNVLWTTWFGGWGDDNAEAVAITDDSNIVIAGVSESFNLMTGNKIDPNSGQMIDDYNVYLLKTDKDGTVLWEKPYGDTLYSEWGTCMAVVSDGYLVAGYQSRTDGEEDLFYLRTDLDGNLAWQKVYGTADADRAVDIVATSDGGFVIGGNTQKVYPTRIDPYLVKINGAGDVLWEKTYGVPERNEILHSMVPAENGDILGIGVSRIGTSADPENDLLYVFRLNPAGDVVWENTYDRSSINVGRSIVEDQLGFLMVCGQDVRENAIHVTKLDGDGTQVWSDSTGAYGYGISMQPSENGYIIAGSTTYPDQEELNDVLMLEFVEDMTNIE